MYYHEPIYAQSSSASSSRIVDYDRGGGGATVHYRAIPPRGDLYSEAKRFTWNEQVRIWRRSTSGFFLLRWNFFLVVMEFFVLPWNLYFWLPWTNYFFAVEFFFCRGICIFGCHGLIILFPWKLIFLPWKFFCRGIVFLLRWILFCFHFFSFFPFSYPCRN
jgi:hypothetical protein